MVGHCGGRPSVFDIFMSQLRKLIVINSYAASRIRELRLDGHVHVAGRNGRGKTTLIRLIPLFYGEQPSKVVKATVCYRSRSVASAAG